MKPIKMFGLAALAALLAMAFVGASSAMAETTTLCSLDPELEAQENSCGVTHVHESTLAGAQATLKTNILTVKCDVLFLSSTKNTGSNPLIVTGNFTYSNCNNSCTATEENGPAEIKVLREGHETSKVTGEGLVHLECGSFIDCLYNGEGLIGTGKGPLLAATEKTNGEVTLTAQKVKEEGGSFFCPDTSELTITTTPLTPTYIGNEKLLHYCVKYEHNTNGRYKDSCKTFVGSNSPEDLVVGPPGLLKGEMVCVHLTATKTGLYEAFKNYKECDKDSAKLSESLYELGEIILVE